MTRLHTTPPSEQIYQTYLSPRYDGLPVEKYFSTRFAYQSEEEWIRMILDGKITVNGEKAVIGQLLRKKDLLITNMGFRTEPAVDRRLDVVYEDRWIRVFNKGAPLPVHPSGRYFHNSLTEILRKVYPDEVPRPTQRLDGITTGLVVFARTREAAAFVMVEFQANRVQKEYLAVVEGVPKSKRFTVEAPIGKLQGSKRAVGKDTLQPKSARTDVEWLSTVDGCSLLKVTPRSGRTHQIRVHLASVGHPIYNDPVYGKGSGAVRAFGLHHRRMRFRCFDTTLELTATCPTHFQPYMDAVGGDEL